MQIVSGTLGKVAASMRRTPSAADVVRLLVEVVWLAPTLVICAILGGLTQGAVQGSAADLALLAIAAFFVPALSEELAFRAALLPSLEPGQRLPWMRILVAASAFVAWHPLQVLIFGPDWARTVLNPWFLAAVGALGIALGRLYVKSGSIWPSVFLHWLVVVTWKGALNGPSPWT